MYLETDPIMSEAEAVEALHEMGALTDQDLKELDLYLSSDEDLPDDLQTKLEMIQLMQVRPPTPSLH